MCNSTVEYHKKKKKKRQLRLPSKTKKEVVVLLGNRQGGTHQTEAGKQGGEGTQRAHLTLILTLKTSLCPHNTVNRCADNLFF